MRDDGQKRPEDKGNGIVILTEKTREELERLMPSPLPKDLILDDLLLGDEWFDDLGFLPGLDETDGMIPDFREVKM